MANGPYDGRRESHEIVCIYDIWSFLVHYLCNVMRHSRVVGILQMPDCLDGRTRGPTLRGERSIKISDWGVDDPHSVNIADLALPFRLSGDYDCLISTIDQQFGKSLDDSFGTGYKIWCI